MVLQIAALALNLAAPTTPFTTAQVQPCVWPNVCRETPVPAPVTLAENDKPFSTCSLPNKCA